MSEIARLSVEIDDVTPRVVRVVEVPADIRLDDLHFVLQIAIGWQNGHPFEFRIGDKLWGQPDRDAGSQSDAGGASDARRYSRARRHLQIRLRVRRGLAAHGDAAVARRRAAGHALSESDQRRGPLPAGRYRRAGRLRDLSAQHRRPEQRRPRGHARIRRAGFRSAHGRRRDAAAEPGRPHALYRPQAALHEAAGS